MVAAVEQAPDERDPRRTGPADDQHVHAPEATGHSLRRCPTPPPRRSPASSTSAISAATPTPDGPVRHGRVFRSDSLAHVNAADVEHLVEERGVRTVVDLRGATEVDAYPNHPMRDAGATIHHVPLIDPAKREQSGFEWETMTLVDLYRFILMSAGPQFVEVMQVIAEPANHPLVFHCAAGKDRAGLDRGHRARPVAGRRRGDRRRLRADLGGARGAARPCATARRRHRATAGRPVHDRRRRDHARGARAGCAPSTAASSPTCSRTASPRARWSCCECRSSRPEVDVLIDAGLGGELRRRRGVGGGERGRRLRRRLDRARPNTIRSSSCSRRRRPPSGSPSARRSPSRSDARR